MIGRALGKAPEDEGQSILIGMKCGGVAVVEGIRVSTVVSFANDAITLPGFFRNTFECA